MDLKSCVVVIGSFSVNLNRKLNGCFIVAIEPRFVEKDNIGFY